ncbi:TPA: WxL domain-containing protein [Enterococcus faecium]
MKKHVTLFSSVLMMSTTLLGAGGVFADTSQPSTGNPKSAETTVTANLTLNQNPEKPTPPTEPEGGTDQPTQIDGLFGIAYAPGTLAGRGQLEDNGETTINLSNNGNNPQNKHNIGVQDKTRGKDRNWTLSAKLEWTNDDQDYLAGSKITATGGNVQLNNGEGTLVPVTEQEVTTDAVSLEISNVSKPVMVAHAGKTVNGVYNYQFKDPKLVIQNSQKVAEGNYEGKIVWDLSDVLA